MGILALLIPLAMILSGLAVVAYIWACRNRQFEDLDAESHKLLFDEELHERTNHDR